MQPEERQKQCGKYKTNKFWRNIKNILMGDLVFGVPTSVVSENHGHVVVHRGIDFLPSGSGALSNVICADGTFETNQSDANQLRKDAVRASVGTSSPTM